jgi:hypothetical protein
VINNPVSSVEAPCASSRNGKETKANVAAAKAETEVATLKAKAELPADEHHADHDRHQQFQPDQQMALTVRDTGDADDAEAEHTGVQQCARPIKPMLGARRHRQRLGQRQCQQSHRHIDQKQ